LEKSALTAQLTNSLAENASLKEGLTAKASALETATQAMNAEFARAASAALEGSGKTFLQLAEAKLSGQQRTANGELTTKKAEIDGLIAPMKATLATLDERVRSLKKVCCKRRSSCREPCGSPNTAATGANYNSGELRSWPECWKGAIFTCRIPS